MSWTSGPSLLQCYAEIEDMIDELRRDGIPFHEVASIIRYMNQPTQQSYNNITLNLTRLQNPVNGLNEEQRRKLFYLYDFANACFLKRKS